jgi:hypothetical protein
MDRHWRRDRGPWRRHTCLGELSDRLVALKTIGLFTCFYLLVGLLITMLMDRYKRLEPRIFVLGVLIWPIALPLAVGSGIREIRRRHRR